MSEREGLNGDPEAVTRLLIATRIVAGHDRFLGGWGGWLDLGLAAGFGAGEALVAVTPATFALTMWGEADGVGELIAKTGAPEDERTRMSSLAPHAAAVGGWLGQDASGFTGGFALRDVAPLRLRMALPGSGISALLSLGEELGLRTVSELRRTVNPGASASEACWPIEAEPLKVLERAAARALGGPMPAATEAIVARASGPCALIIKAGQRAITGLGLRVPIASSESLAATLAAFGATYDTQLARICGALGVERPSFVDVMRKADGASLRFGAL